MSFLPRLGAPEPAVAVVGGGALLVLILWLSWRKPTWLLMLALASLAIRPQVLWGGPQVGWHWGLHQTLIVFALAMNALRYGVRTTINWPILALVVIFALNLLLGVLHPDVNVALMAESLALFALPFAIPQVVLAPGSRRALALVIALAPLLSVALGGLLQLAGVHAVFSYDQWTENWYRLAGAIGDPATFAALAFAGFAVALHEWTRPGRRYAIYLAIVNLALVILSGTRHGDLRLRCVRWRPCPPLGGPAPAASARAVAGAGRPRTRGGNPRRLLADPDRAHVRRRY